MIIRLIGWTGICRSNAKVVRCGRPFPIIGILHFWRSEEQNNLPLTHCLSLTLSRSSLSSLFFALNRVKFSLSFYLLPHSFLFTLFFSLVLFEFYPIFNLYLFFPLFCSFFPSPWFFDLFSSIIFDHLFNSSRKKKFCRKTILFCSLDPCGHRVVGAIALLPLHFPLPRFSTFFLFNSTFSFPHGHFFFFRGDH